MKSIRVCVNAKINLSLNVLGTLENNYHLIESVMASVNISDAVSIVKRSDKTVYLSSRDMAVGANNSAVKAANAFITAFSTQGCDITISKRIPFSGGMGGSSADAAAVLRGLAELYGIHDKKPLAELAATLGSDVPYMCDGGFKIVGGAGERLTDIATSTTLYMVLAKPERGVSTAECYRAYDQIGGKNADNKLLVNAIKANNLVQIAANTSNALENAATKLMPEIAIIKKELIAQKPLSVHMTGSGSTLVALCGSPAQAEEIAKNIKKKAHWAGAFKTVKNGIWME